MKKNKIAFTLIEILISILISSIIIIVWFEALTATTIWKSKLIDSTNISKETFFFTQKLFEEIKKGWTIDYEEYFNRKVVWNISFSSWHFSIPTWFGNFWSGWNVWSTTYWDLFYSCRSWDWIRNQMWTWWCATNNFNTYWTSVLWKPQRYWEYSFQFIDYNSNFDDDLWDEDSVNWIIWDDDDEYLWIWPEVFSWATNVKELYLISADKKKRVIFRWNLENDLNKPSSATCNISWWTFTWTWCIWTVEYLKLDWKDRWINHIIWDWDNWEYDWVIDTWIVNPDFAWWIEVVAWSNSTNYWLPLFPDTINVADFQIFAYPNKDIKLSWKDSNRSGINVSPYVKIKMKLMPSWKTKKKIKWKVPEFELNTTVSLTDIYSR